MPYPDILIIFALFLLSFILLFSSGCAAAMGFFGKSEPSEDDIQSAPPVQDVEKRDLSQEENGRHVQPTSVTATPIDPVLERRVLRKLDWRIPPLTGFLCMMSRPLPTRNTIV